jgi:hypothetical protein
MQGNILGHAPATWPGASMLKVFNRSDSDAAWENDNKRTNYHLCDGDTVILKVDTKGQFSNGYFTVPAGTQGIVINARTTRVAMFAGNQSKYFANVDVIIDGQKGRIRVPHGALRAALRTH